MATNISLDTYHFSTGMDLAYKQTTPFQTAKIVNYERASIYNFRGQYFSGVRSKITTNIGDVMKDHFVAQTVAEIKSAIDA